MLMYLLIKQVKALGLANTYSHSFRNLRMNFLLSFLFYMKSIEYSIIDSKISRTIIYDLTCVFQQVVFRVDFHQ
jgi:hypothetical protein